MRNPVLAIPSGILNASWTSHKPRMITKALCTDLADTLTWRGQHGDPTLQWLANHIHKYATPEPFRPCHQSSAWKDV